MSCPSCGAAMAEDQRYCLNCGQRQGGPRVDFPHHLEARRPQPKVAAASGDGTAEPAAAVAPPPDRRQRDYAPLAAAGGIAVLGIMLLIGVLIGRGTGSDQAAAPTPQVVTVAQGEGGAADKSEAGEGATQDAGKNKAEKGGKKKDVVAGGSTDTGNAPVASEQQLEALQGKTGQEYAEESAKLPDEIATPGAPPPTDNKAPGGGSGGTTIE